LPEQLAVGQLPQPLAGSQQGKYESVAGVSFVGLLFAVHEPVYAPVLGVAAGLKSAGRPVASVDALAELVAEASAVLEVFGVLGLSAVLEAFVAPAAVAKSDLAAAVGVKGAPVVALSAAVPIAIAHCIEPVELKADLEMAAGSEVSSVADVQQMAAEWKVDAAAHIVGLFADLHEPERRAKQIVEPHKSSLWDQESC
jgi:hypothetical protein